MQEAWFGRVFIENCLNEETNLWLSQSRCWLEQTIKNVQSNQEYKSIDPCLLFDPNNIYVPGMYV